MSKKKGILKHWPLSKDKPPRETQIRTLKWTEKLPSEVKYILYEIPVGGGKSPLAVNYSAWISKTLGDAFILTTQKILQKQYEDSFDSTMLRTVYGKNNYECSTKGTNCDIGGDIKPACKGCPAKSALYIGNKSPNMVLNYKLALLYFRYLDEDTLKKRDVMVFDECHTLEHHLTEFKAITVNEKKCKKLKVKFKKCDNVISGLKWLREDFYPVLSKFVKKQFQEVENISDKYYESNSPLTANDKHLLKEYRKWSEYEKNILDLLNMNETDINNEYVLVNDAYSFKFKELYGKNVFHQYVKPMADKFLFMSSTILDKDAFCRDLGINPDEAAFISLPSEFPIDNRPVIYSPIAKMNYGWDSQNQERNADRRNMLQRIVEICDGHDDVNGIIHTGSFKIANWLVQSLQGQIPHRIFEHSPESGYSRDDVIAEFMECAGVEPAILISPSITEGLDLVGDMGRFAIFAKIPYPFLGDQWIKKRMKISSEWYQRQALMAVIQGGGRVVRSKEDWGYTYILDQSFGYLHYSMGNKIPPWWSEAYVKM